MNSAKPRVGMIVSRQSRLHGVLLACGLAAVLAACSSTVNTVVDSMPSEIGGMPSDTPERPPVPPAYPAVHDMPPPRSSVTLTAEEQENLESELAAVRTRQDVIVAGAQAPVPARAKAKKRPAPAAAAPRVIPATTSSNTIY